MELRNRMQAKPIATIEMDLLGLSQRNQPLPKEDPMKNEVVLRLKDDSPAPSNMPVANWPAIRRRLAAAAREVDATCASLGIQSSIEQQVLDAVNQTMNPSKSANPFMDAWLASQEKFKNEQYARRIAREFQAAQSVPLAKRIVPGFAKVY